MANLKVLILDNLVSQGTLGIQSLSEAKALLIDCVLRRSFLFEPTPSGGCKFNFDFLVTEDEGVELEAKLTLEAEVLLQKTQSMKHYKLSLLVKHMFSIVRTYVDMQGNYAWNS